jgi:CelD/BcsL family acetyltransferase involved in cellulose biosynthesis
MSTVAPQRAVAETADDAPPRASIGTVADLDERLTNEWLELGARSNAPPFVMPDWVTAWSEAFSPEPLRVLTVRRGDRLVGVAPLEHDEAQPPFNWHQGESGFVAEEAAAARQVADAVLDLGPGQLNLRNVRHDAPELEACRAAAGERGYRTTVEMLQRSPFVTVDGDWEAYRARRGKRLRKNLKRYRRKLDEKGEVTVTVTRPGPDRAGPLLEEGFAVEAAGWKGEAGTAILSRPDTRRFYTLVGERAAQRGSLVLGFVRLDGRAISFVMALQFRGVHYSIKEGYDPDFAFASPGTLAFEAEMRHAFEEGMRRVELMGEETPHKLAWADGSDERVRLAAFAPGVRGSLGHLLHARVRPAAKRLRELAKRNGR